MSFNKARLTLNQIQKAAIYYLIGCGWTDAQIGRAIGYMDGGMVGKVKNEGHLFGSEASWLFARLCSAEGYQDVGVAYLADGYVPVSVPVDYDDDGDPTPEMRGVLEGLGQTSSLYDDDPIAANQSAARTVTAALALHMETQNRVRETVRGEA